MSTGQSSQVNAVTSTQEPRPTKLTAMAVTAWFLCSLYYSYQYAVRSALPVMRTEMAASWGSGNVIGHMISNYYVVYSFVALVAGLLLDRYGARKTLPYATATVAVCCFLLSTGKEALGSFAFVAQAAPAVFGFIGAVYVAAKYIPPRNLSFFVGSAQMLGMAGAAFGSKPVSAALHSTSGHPVAWQSIWAIMAVIGAVLAVVMWIVLPRDNSSVAKANAPLTLKSLIRPYQIVFENAQTYLCGLIGGLLFVPTTVFALVWATNYLHEGRNASIAVAATDVSLVPIGWIIGCPLVGYISDKIGLRKPVLLVGAFILLLAEIVAIYVPIAFPFRYIVPLVVGIASGAAMIPFSVVKEVNRDEVKGSAAGAMNFLCFMVTGLLAPAFERLLRPSAGHVETLQEFQHGLTPVIFGVAVAIVLSFFLRETGQAAQQRQHSGLAAAGTEPVLQLQPAAGD
jgi:MFS family permease